MGEICPILMSRQIVLSRLTNTPFGGNIFLDERKKQRKKFKGIWKEKSSTIMSVNDGTTRKKEAVSGMLKHPQL